MIELFKKEYMHSQIEIGAHVKNHHVVEDVGTDMVVPMDVHNTVMEKIAEVYGWKWVIGLQGWHMAYHPEKNDIAPDGKPILWEDTIRLLPMSYADIRELHPCARSIIKIKEVAHRSKDNEVLWDDIKDDLEDDLLIYDKDGQPPMTMKQVRELDAKEKAKEPKQGVLENA